MISVWFLVALPAVLFLLLLLVGFTGCTARLEGPIPTLTFKADLRFEADPGDPWPNTEKVVFHWIVVPLDGAPLSGEEAIRDGVPHSEGGTTTIPFLYEFPDPPPGEWCVSCKYFTTEADEGSHWWGVDDRAFTLTAAQQLEAGFEITSEGGGGWQVRRTGGNPCDEG